MQRQFAEAISAFQLDGSTAMANLVEVARKEDPTAEEVAYLAMVLAGSGQMLDFPSGAGPIADIASSGGSGSLTTIIGPLFLITAGVNVVKLGVPGRPAGAVDVLAQIPGYNLHLNDADIHKCVQQSKFAHFVSGDRFAPKDDLLFRYRSQSSAKAIPALIISSVLAKKLAVGIKYVALDLRVGSAANFADTRQEADKKVPLISKVARLMGITCRCHVSDSDKLPQPFLGRGEALLALSDWLNSRCSEWLLDHIQDARFIAGDLLSCMGTQKQIEEEPPIKIFDTHLRAQGSSFSAFEEQCSHISKQPRTPTISNRSGVFSPKMHLLRETISGAQAACVDGQRSFPDPCGVIFKVKPNTQVSPGTELATVRAPSEDLLGRLSTLLQVI